MCQLLTYLRYYEWGVLALCYLRARKWKVTGFWVFLRLYQPCFIFGNSPSLKRALYVFVWPWMVFVRVRNTEKYAVLPSYTYVFTCIRTHFTLLCIRTYVYYLYVLIFVYYVYVRVHLYSYINVLYSYIRSHYIWFRMRTHMYLYLPISYSLLIGIYY